ncbi:metal-binding protein ZinT [Oceanobacillus polygoni]|uniref:Zinc transport system substrate-binding protein n=1 Tax=Oceanobacillus polygoni TaxID=1235259 RepID=A0A9X0YUV6_9BACI|nr:metal-binding protein ZinT [Oceanobacillus polygoni]MBP2077416.1 zinc transport system substrate-binding protein [Oceanobacillus polygoni]
MKFLSVKGLSVLTLSILLLIGCQNADLQEGEEQKASSATEHEHDNSNDPQAPEEVDIQGVADHYHTGDIVELTAVLEEESDFDHWHWYIRDNQDDEWDLAPEQETSNFKGEATNNGQQIKVVLYNDEHEAYVQSEPIEIVIDDHDDHDHNHSHDDEIYNGYFEDSQVKDRALSDWEGDWQSVYPYLQDGTLDEVFTHKSEQSGDMTAEEYKEYYDYGYETDVDRIIIQEDTVTFFKQDNELTGEYVYDGYEILTYEAGNRGVRFIFKLAEDNDELPQFIQFSDHNIYPTDSGHYHLYWGNDREALLDEVENWPTYYPTEMDGDAIVHEMIAH